MTMRFYLTTLLTACANILLAQQATFWQQTPTHPATVNGYGNICITMGAGNAVFTGTTDQGIFRTTDQGNSWQQVLTPTDTSIVKIWSDQHGKLFAIGSNVVFASADNGNSWERKVVPTQYPVTDLEVMSNGHLIVSTSGIVDHPSGEYDYYGDGIFISADGGNTWQQKNNGIGYNKAITHIAVSSGNVLVAAMAGYNNNSGGIYYSNDLGQNWVRKNMPSYVSKRDNTRYTPSSIYEAHYLDFKEGDTLYYSYNGTIFGNAGGSGGLKISRDHFIQQDNTWEQIRITPNGYEWLYKPFMSIHHAKKQAHTYAGIDGGQSAGAAYLLQHNKDTAFRRVNSGLEQVNGTHPHMLYAEDSEGRIYGILYSGNLVYYTDSSKALSSGIGDRPNQELSLSVYPNPASSVLNIRCDVPGNKIGQVAMFSMEGKLCLKMEQVAENMVTIPLDALNDGVYFVQVQTAEGSVQKKIYITR